MLIGDQEPLEWILRNQRTAFTDRRAREGGALRPGDTLFLYTTRGCFRNPARDRGSVIGKAVVLAPARRSDPPPAFGARTYPWVVELRIESLAKRGLGVELAPLVPRLKSTFPDPATWSAQMRRALVALDEEGAAIVATKLDRSAAPFPDEVATYSG
jgi:hypothetical protein